MAGATVATWVKVRTKTGLTSRPISHKYEGGANYEKGQVITQSEYEAIKSGRSEKEKGNGGDTPLTGDPTAHLDWLRQESKKGFFGDQFAGSAFSDAGKMKQIDVEDINGSISDNLYARKVAKLLPTNENSQVPVMIVQRSNGKNELIGDSTPLSASKIRGKQRVNAVVVPDDPWAIAQVKALSKQTESDAFSIPPPKKISSWNNAGKMLTINSDEITGKITKSPDVKKAAKLLKKTGGYNYVPVLLKEVGEDKYEVVGNHFAYSAAKAAKSEVINTLVVSSIFDK